MFCPLDQLLVKQSTCSTIQQHRGFYLHVDGCGVTPLRRYTLESVFISLDLGTLQDGLVPRPCDLYWLLHSAEALHPIAATHTPCITGNS